MPEFIDVNGRVRRRDELVGSLKTTPGRYIMSSDLTPYQADAAIPDSTTCPGGQCVLRFPTVPAGKRLVIESVSAQLGPVANALVLEGSGVAYFVPKLDPNIGVLASQVTVYYDTGHHSDSADLCWQLDPTHLSDRHARRSPR